jgi:succinyl-CoA synthetase beta subunit
LKIHEYQAKEVLARYDIPVQEGYVATTPAEAEAIAQRIGRMVVVKAQVHAGGRGKAGGVKLAQTPTEARDKAAAILGMQIKGITVKKALVTVAADIAHEYYLGVVLDRASKRVMLIGSAEGGVEIEETAKTTPEKIIRIAADPALGLGDYQARELAFAMQIPAALQRDFLKIVHGLYNAFVATDASLAEINPLVITQDGKLEALDAKIVLDDNALYRHPDLEAYRDLNEEEPAEITAREANLSYVKLDGNIGCMVNGAGLAMSTMDTIKLYGGEPANFLDVGGSADAARVTNALRIILSDPHVKAILFNIFGGIVRCDEVAKGIIIGLKEVQTDVPLVIRLVGTNQAEGRRILSEANLIALDNMDEAVKKVVEVANSR